MYKVDTKPLYKPFWFTLIFGIVGLLLLIFILYAMLTTGKITSDSPSISDPVSNTYESPETNTTFVTPLILIGIPLIFIAVPVIALIVARRKIAKIKILCQHGQLIKNLPYTLEDSNTTVNNNRLQRIVVKYTPPNGIEITLKGDPRWDRKTSDADGKVDLLIDPNDPKNYYIDFNIEPAGAPTMQQY
jgi:hypothetical protein